MAAAAKERGNVRIMWPPAPTGSTLATLAVTHLNGLLEGDRQKVPPVTFQVLPWTREINPTETFHPPCEVNKLGSIHTRLPGRNTRFNITSSLGITLLPIQP